MFCLEVILAYALMPNALLDSNKPVKPSHLLAVNLGDLGWLYDVHVLPQNLSKLVRQVQNEEVADPRAQCFVQDARDPLEIPLQPDLDQFLRAERVAHAQVIYALKDASQCQLNTMQRVGLCLVER